MARGDTQRPDAQRFPGEPGVGRHLPPPFTAHDDATAWLFSLNRFGIRPGLRRIRELLAALGNPERDLRTFVIAGTNGKGSTTRILGTLLRAAGYKVATFTSPHLLQVYERIQVDERPISPARFAAKVDALRPAVERYAASWFETLTALAVDIAREEEVDFLCCETGLGGRLDATNALPAVATFLTTVDLDHQKILGSTRQAIAAEKLGLLKPGADLFCGLSADLYDQVRRAAAAAGADCFLLDELARWENTGSTWRLELPERTFADLPPLSVPVLHRNAALVLLALSHLAGRGLLQLPPAPGPALADALLPGRFQLVLRDPDWILDTAHNPQALAVALAGFAAKRVSGRRYLLYGGLRDKELPTDFAARVKGFDSVLAAPIQLPRSRSRQELEDLWRAESLPGRVCADLTEAVARLTATVLPEDAVLVTGSCFLVAEVLYNLGYDDIEQTRSVRSATEVVLRPRPDNRESPFQPSD